MGWVGGTTAVLSLLFGVLQLRDLVESWRAQERSMQELSRAARLQMETGDYEGAVALLRDGASGGGSRGAAAPPPELASVQLEATMAELRESAIVGDESFDDLVGRLVPTLRRAVGSTSGSLLADVLAHIGWAQFLRFREGRGGRDQVASYYEKALEVDPDNVYAHTMTGHWALWPTGNMYRKPDADRFALAKRHFGAALQASREREREWVLGMQVAAWTNIGSAAYRVETLRFANELRRSGQMLSAAHRDRILAIYTRARHDRDFEIIAPALTAGEHIDTIVWLAGAGGTSMGRGSATTEVLGRFLREEGDAIHARRVLDALEAGLDPASRAMLQSTVEELEAT